MRKTFTRLASGLAVVAASLALTATTASAEVAEVTSFKNYSDCVKAGNKSGSGYWYCTKDTDGWWVLYTDPTVTY